MTKNEKRMLTVFCLILAALTGCILLRYYHRVTQIATLESQQSPEEQRSLIGYHYTTTAAQLTKSEDPEGKTSRRTFTHAVFTPDEQDLATVTVTVSGALSGERSGISHISTSLTEEEMDGLTISEHISGQTATIVLYMNQISVCHFQYRLASDGSIDSL